MESNCSSSDLFRPNFARNKRPRDDVGMDFGSPLTAKRIHFLSERSENPDAPFDRVVRPEAPSKNTVATAEGGERKTLEESDCLAVLYSKMLKEGDPQILNLSKSENGDRSFRGRRSSPEDELMENDAEYEDNLPMDLSKRCFDVQTMAAGLLDEIDKCKATDFIGNGFSHFDDNDEKTVEKLVEELRNEETILVLLSKIRQSQLLHRLVKDGGGVDITRPTGISARQASGLSSLLVPSLRSSRSDAHRLGHHHHRTANETSRPMQEVHARQQQPPIVPLHLAAAAADASVSSSRSPYSVPPSSSATASSSQPGHHRSHAYLPPAPSHVQPEAGGQSQAAAKVALRRQLEKTLLQIPPPKPPPPEMNFIPNFGNGDFVTLLGLEEAVKCILDNDARAGGEPVSEVKYVFSPFQCVQCQTDFTPVWKRDKPGSKSVICERCVTNNQKLVLKQEHTNRLKSAFVKALQQEQEIDQSLLLLTQTPTTVSLAQRSSPHSLSVLSKNPTNVHRSGLETLQHSSSRHLQQQHHLVLSPRQSTTLWTPPTASGAAGASQTFDPRLMFAFHRPQVNSKSPSVDLQRQYLLDLIPRRSHLDGRLLWRT